jgi:hypothetical protein
MSEFKMEIAKGLKDMAEFCPRINKGGIAGKLTKASACIGLSIGYAFKKYPVASIGVCGAVAGAAVIIHNKKKGKVTNNEEVQ